jgi:hypothetical protein
MSFAVFAVQDDKKECAGHDPGRFARTTRRVIQITPTIAMIQGARNAIATPIIRRLHVMALALCASVRRSVASKPLSCEMILPWL